MLHHVPLSATEEAYTALVLEEHATNIRLADAKRDARMKVLLSEKGIPDGVHVKVERHEGHEGALLTYDGNV